MSDSEERVLNEPSIQHRISLFCSLQFLSPEELSDTSENVKLKVIKVLTELAASFTKAEIQRRGDKIVFEQQIFDMESILREKADSVESLTTLLENERKNSESYLEKHRDVLEQLNSSEQSSASKIADLETELSNSKIQFTQVAAENEDLLSMLEDERKNSESLTTLLENERKNAESYLEKYRNVLSQLNIAETKIADLEKELSASKIQFTQAAAEKDDLLSIVEERNVEIDKLTQDMKNANDELQSATVSKIEALTKVDELEIELGCKEKEQEWMSEQVQLLNEELDKKNVEIIEIQRETSLKFLGVQTDLAEKTEELRNAEMSLENVKKDNDNQEQQIARLVEKLKEAQLQLEESTKRCREIEIGLVSQGSLQDEIMERDKSIEKLEQELSDANELLLNIRKQGLSLQDEIMERDKSIEKLEQELSDANELLLNIQKQGLTDEVIQLMSPPAGAAAEMLKSSHSVAEVFSRFQTIYAELHETRAEDEKLNACMKQMLQIIMERAPALRRQKDDYERCLKTVDALTTQFDYTLQEVNNFRVENARLKETLDRANISKI